MKINLLTRDGEFVTEVEIPMFKLMPEVLVWGERTFVYSPGVLGAYYEGFAYYIPPVPKVNEDKSQG
jgi:hypothetical protein